MISLSTNLTIGPVGSKATTQLTNFNFNSYMTFQNRSLAVADNGLYEITGITNNESPVSAYIIPITYNLNVLGKKRLRYIYIKAYVTGNLSVEITSENGVATIVIPVTTIGWRQLRARIPRSVKGSNLIIKISNVAGSDFTISKVDIKPIILSNGHN